MSPSFGVWLRLTRPLSRRRHRRVLGLGRDRELLAIGVGAFLWEKTILLMLRAMHEVNRSDGSLVWVGNDSGRDAQLEAQSSEGQTRGSKSTFSAPAVERLEAYRLAVGRTAP